MIKVLVLIWLAGIIVFGGWSAWGPCFNPEGTTRYSKHDGFCVYAFSVGWPIAMPFYLSIKAWEPKNR